MSTTRDTYEIHTDGGDVALRVCVICEPEQQARLSDTGVSDEEELEKVVVSEMQPSAGLGEVRICASRRNESQAVEERYSVKSVSHMLPA